ncbi:hypothetical protein B7494_g2852 [Chlorociboria aeruginascens]|nr:hypothetical protein B7494_g2852 [Chlorociboria aeruginascens]
MLIRGQKRLLPLLFVPISLVFLIFCLRFYDETLIPIPFPNQKWTENAFPTTSDPENTSLLQDTASDAKYPLDPDLKDTHNEIFSVSTQDGKYFSISFGREQTMNPNILPHPVKNDTWIVAAQHFKVHERNSAWSATLVCDAVFENDVLTCITSPMMLPIAATTTDKCSGDISYYALNIGPHDARVFYGPESPFAIWGAQSAHSCFGLWIQDFRMLMDWEGEFVLNNDFRFATDLQRPPPYGIVEKNWFVFWDREGEMYTHYDIYPKRTFAKLALDGSVGINLAAVTKDADEKCLQKFTPRLGPEMEDIHQASNSLAITLCKRSDPACKESDNNTFILTIFQLKIYHAYHGVYEPYVMLFEQKSPFGIHYVSQKPLWISGRRKKDEARPPNMSEEDAKHLNQTEMIYVTSISWKTPGLIYHGYLDDVMFLNFGIEDARAGAIDVLAGDLLRDMGVCEGS